MIGAIPRPGSGGGGSAVDQTARDAAAAAQTTATSAQQDAATRAPQTALDELAAVLGGKASSQAVTDLATAVDQANAAQNTEIGRKANADDVTTSLAGKVGNIAFAAFKAAQETKDQEHDAAIGAKADAAATTTALAGKVSTASFTTFSDAVVQKNGEQDTEIARRAVKTDVDAALADKASVTALGAQATRVDGIIGADGNGGRMKTAETGLATVQADLNTAGTGVKAKVEDLRTRTGQLESGFANVSAAVTPVLLKKLRLASGFTAKTVADFIAEHFPNQNIGTVTALGLLIGGGGASGFAYSTSGTAPTKYGGGGLPGQILRMRRCEVALTDTIEASIGLGGARASALGTSNANAFAQNAGSPSSVTLKKSNGTQRFRLEAKGGQTYLALSAYLSGSGSFTFWNASTALYQFLPFVHQPLTGGLPGWMTGTGSGSGTTGYTETDADAKAFVNGPTAGGSTLFGGIPSARGGNGGAIQYEPSEWTPDVGVVLGGLGATGVSLNGGAGVSSMEPGTFGTGGGGTFYDYRYLAQGGDGGFPSAGGGEAVNYYSVGTCVAGKGGDGFLDIFIYGYPAAK